MQNYRNNAMYRPMPAPVTPCVPANDDDMVLAMAYVKWQKWQNMHTKTKFENIKDCYYGLI